MIRVFVADDHAIVRDGLARVLDAAPDLTCAGGCGDTDTLLDAVAQAEWDVLVLDLSMPGGGLQVLEQVHARRPEIPVVVYSMYPEEQFGPQALRAGAAAYLAKGRPTAELLTALRRAADGRRYVTQAIAEQLLEGAGEDRPLHERLSDREREVFHLLVTGLSTADIARQLHVSKPTVSTHIRHIKDKTGLHSVAEMVSYAHRAGLRQ